MAETTITTLPGQRSDGADRRLPVELPALVILWCREQPERVGEVSLLELQRAGESLELGRGEDPKARRAVWLRHRPSGSSVMPAMSSPRLSRRQLELRMTAEGEIEVENVGRIGLIHRRAGASEPGRSVTGCRVAPFDILELEGELLLLVTSRPQNFSWFGADKAPKFEFGKADANGLVGESSAAWTLRERIAFCAARDPHVLVHGQSGVGKELVAQALHRGSSRAGKPLVSRNAATIPEGLADAELFGNAKNYPHAGLPERPGLIGEAHQSTLFLDEFGELPEAVQARLLRVMDAGEYQRLGETRARHSDFRLIGATNRPAVALKHDVLARFALRLEIPGLNERREDIPLVAAHLLRRFGERDPLIAQRFFPSGDVKASPRFTIELVTALVQHHYTTHVRELEAGLWAALSDARGSFIEASPAFCAMFESASGADPKRAPALTPEAIQACLDRHGGQQEPAWRELGLSSRHVLTRLVRRYNLEVRGRGGSTASNGE